MIINQSKNFLLIIANFLLSNNCIAQNAGLVRYVNTLQGTNSSRELSAGNTYPTTALPFCVHAWSPQTGRNGDGWKYKYTEKTIRCFGETQQRSPWAND